MANGLCYFRSRRFGFITFASKDAVDTAQAARPHTMENKQITTKRSIPKGVRLFAMPLSFVKKKILIIWN